MGRKQVQLNCFGIQNAIEDDDGDVILYAKTGRALCNIYRDDMDALCKWWLDGKPDAQPTPGVIGRACSKCGCEMHPQANGIWCAECGKYKADMVSHPPHYQRGGMEVIDVIEAFELGFRLGNCAKYILRAGHKGDRLEDLKKAEFYLKREIAKSEGQP